MAKTRYADPNKATHRDYLGLRRIDQINEHAKDGDYLYYAKPYYDNAEHSTGLLLLSYAIRKETQCFYLLQCGMRIAKRFDKRSFADNPHDAARYCVARTQNYFNILIKRAHSVQNFLKEMDCMRRERGQTVRELQIFEDLAKQFDDTDHIPVELFRDFKLNPELRIGDILR
jgi:hypothetical protein